MLKGRNYIDPTNFSMAELDEVMDLAKKIKENPVDYLDVCKGKLLATLFYEPSTRTRFSF